MGTGKCARRMTLMRSFREAVVPWIQQEPQYWGMCLAMFSGSTCFNRRGFLLKDFFDTWKMRKDWIKVSIPKSTSMKIGYSIWKRPDLQKLDSIGTCWACWHCALAITALQEKYLGRAWNLLYLDAYKVSLAWHDSFSATKQGDWQLRLFSLGSIKKNMFFFVGACILSGNLEARNLEPEFVEALTRSLTWSCGIWNNIELFENQWSQDLRCVLDTTKHGRDPCKWDADSRRWSPETAVETDCWACAG